MRVWRFEFARLDSLTIDITFSKYLLCVPIVIGELACKANFPTYHQPSSKRCAQGPGNGELEVLGVPRVSKVLKVPRVWSA
jgi:hypothetical protein